MPYPNPLCHERSAVSFRRPNTKGRSQLKTKQLVIDAMLVAVYYVLSSYLSVNLGGLRVSLDVLPVAVAAALFGPVNGLVVGFVGNFLFQLAGPYGISVTTVLWALPDAARGLLAGALLGRGKWAAKSFWQLAAGLSLVSLVFTTLTTGVMYVDCLVYHYAFAAYAPFIVTRYILGIAVALLLAGILPPLLKALQKNAPHYGGAAA